MDNDNWNCKIPLSMTAVIELKIFKLLTVLLQHLISQLPQSMTAALRTTFVFNLVFKLILDFFSKVFISPTQDFPYFLMAFFF